MTEDNCETVEDVKHKVKDVDVLNSNENYVSYFNPSRGYGFIYDVSKQQQFFFHISNVSNVQVVGGRIELFDKILSYRVENSKKDGRPQAVDIVLKSREEA